MRSTWLLIALVASAYAISIPVSSQHEKCMVVYSQTPEDYLKLDMKFQRFLGQTEQEYYLINLYNTENNHVESFNVTEGLFRREIQLQQNVIYKLCVQIILNRYGSAQIQKFVEYNSGVRHSIDADTKVDVPENLLKIKDLQKTYSELLALLAKLQIVKTEAKTIQNEQDSLFKQQTTKIGEIENITIIEIVAITAFGVYQYFRLRNVIDNKQRG